MNEIFPTGPCVDHEHDLVDLLEGSLGPERARAIRQHADSCPRCCAWLAEFAALDERLADAMPRPALSADFDRALQDRLATRVPWQRRHRPWLSWSSPAGSPPAGRSTLDAEPAITPSWLASQGFDVTGIDVSAAAVARAEALAQSKGAACRFSVVELLEPTTLFDACFEFAYDWLVLHHVFPADRPRYAANVHRMLRPGALYLSVCFSEDDRGIAGEGKYRQPRLGTQLYLSSEQEIRELFEPLFDVLELGAVDVVGTRSPHKAVRALMRKRT